MPQIDLLQKLTSSPKSPNEPYELNEHLNIILESLRCKADEDGQNKILQTDDWAEMLSHIIDCMNLEQFEEVEIRIL